MKIVIGYDGQRREVDERTPEGRCRHLVPLDRQWCYRCPPGVPPRCGCGHPVGDE